MNLKNCVLVIAVIAFVAFVSSSFGAHPAPTRHVTDLAHILSSPAVDQLDAQLAEAERQTSNQIIVYTAPSLEGNQLESYTVQLAKKWGVGQKDKNNGAILFVFMGERKIRIEVGYGLEPRLTDATCKRIINDMVPLMKAKQMDAAIKQAAGQMLQAVKGEFKAAAVSAPSTPGGGEFTIGWLWIVIGIVAVIIVVGVIVEAAGSSSGSCGGGFFSGGSSGGGSGGGGGGDFSGGGGGFGGGGASGGF